MRIGVVDSNNYSFISPSKMRGSTVNTENIAVEALPGAVEIRANDHVLRSSGKRTGRSRSTMQSAYLKLSRADLKAIFDAAIKAKLILIPGIADIEAARKSLDAAADKLGLKNG